MAQTREQSRRPPCHRGGGLVLWTSSWEAGQRIWFWYEQAADELQALRETAYFDVGVEYGIGATRATAMAGTRPAVNTLAQRVVRELMRTGVVRDEVVGALIVAAWAMLGGTSARTPSR